MSMRAADSTPPEPNFGQKTPRPNALRRNGRWFRRQVLTQLARSTRQQRAPRLCDAERRARFPSLRLRT